jgi:hypothetical protein
MVQHSTLVRLQNSALSSSRGTKDLRDDLQKEEAQLTSEATASQSSIPKLFIMTVLT